MSTEAMKLALEAIRGVITWDIMRNHLVPYRVRDPLQEAITALREALAEQPAQQDPVAWMTKTGSVWKTKADETDEPLYTSPPAQQEPVEYWTVANGWVSDQAEVPAAVWVEPDFWEHCNRVNCGTAYRLPAPGRQPLYTSSPSQRKPLTDEELEEIVKRGAENKPFHHWFARAIEAAHGIKTGGAV